MMFAVASRLIARFPAIRIVHQAGARNLEEARAAYAEHATDEPDENSVTIAQLQGRIRASHLQTHLAEKALLTPEQMQLYAGMRAMGH